MLSTPKSPFSKFPFLNYDNIFIFFKLFAFNSKYATVHSTTALRMYFYWISNVSKIKVDSSTKFDMRIIFPCCCIFSITHLSLFAKHSFNFIITKTSFTCYSFLTVYRSMFLVKSLLFNAMILNIVRGVRFAWNGCIEIRRCAPAVVWNG